MSADGGEPALSQQSLEAIYAEQALLGIIVFDSSVMNDISLRADQFSLGVHQSLYQLALDNHAAGRVTDFAVVMDRLKGNAELTELGGAQYVLDLIDKSPPRVGVHTYVDMVQAAWERREIARIARETVQGISEGKETANVMAGLRRDLEALESGAAHRDDGVSSDVAGAQVLDEIDGEVQRGAVKGYKCGIAAIDRRLGGLLPESLIVAAGRPSMGKTAFGGAVMFGAALQNPQHQFIIFSMEMSKRQIIERALSRLSAKDSDPIPYDRIGKNDVLPWERQRLHELRRHLPKNLIIFDQANKSVDDVRRAVWAIRRRGPLAAIMIDYLQIMRRPRADGRNESTVIGEMTMGLKQIAKEAHIAALLLSQLSRQVEQRDDKRPQLSDLRESGAIEQDADAVIFPYREVYYLERAEPRKDSKSYADWEMQVAELNTRMDVIVGKNRHGSVGYERQVFRAEFDLVENWKG